MQSPDDANQNTSLSTLLATLIPVLLISAIYFGLFLIFRARFRRQYEPRSFLASLRDQERTPGLPGGLFGWIGQFSKIPDSWVLNHQSIDGYLFLRFLKISCIICLVGCCITFPILWPVYATGGNQQQQLAILTLGNVAPPNNPRLYAATFVAWAFYGKLATTLPLDLLNLSRLRLAHDCARVHLLH